MVGALNLTTNTQLVSTWDSRLFPPKKNTKKHASLSWEGAFCHGVDPANNCTWGASAFLLVPGNCYLLNPIVSWCCSWLNTSVILSYSDNMITSLGLRVWYTPKRKRTQLHFTPITKGKEVCTEVFRCCTLSFMILSLVTACMNAIINQSA